MRQLLRYEVVFPIAAVIMLIVIAQLNFLLFHTLAELFSIVVSFLMFAIAWQTTAFSRNPFVMVLACGYVWIGGLDLMHTLSYKGIGILDQGNANMATQLWIGSRYLESLTLLAASLAFRYPVNRHLALAGFGISATALAAVIFTGHFPDAFIEGQGLTPFKVQSEFLVIGLLAGAILHLYSVRQHASGIIVRLMMGAILLTIIAELEFTNYVSVYGFANMLGHLAKFLSYWLIYLAIVRSTLRQPYKMLDRSRVEAQQANRAKSEFLARMSHDLRTPLNAIIGFSELMARETFGPIGDKRYHGYLEDVQKSGKLLVALVNDILDMSKIEAGKMNLHLESLTLAPVVEEAVGINRALSNQAGVSIATDLPSTPVQIIGDERALLQMFNNLISNAIKFNRPGGEVRIKVRCQSGGGLTVEVIDNGIGMSPSTLSSALEPFEQGESNPMVSHQGSGLGLFLCSQFAKIQNIDFHIQSHEGQGTTAALAFPPSITIVSCAPHPVPAEEPPRS